MFACQNQVWCLNSFKTNFCFSNEWKRSLMYYLWKQQGWNPITRTWKRRSAITKCNQISNRWFRIAWFWIKSNLKEFYLTLFLKQEFLLNKYYQYGMVASKFNYHATYKVKIKYQNSKENIGRETSLSVCQLVMIRPVAEIYIIQELNKIKN